MHKGLLYDWECKLIQNCELVTNVLGAFPSFENAKLARMVSKSHCDDLLIDLTNWYNTYAFYNGFEKIKAMELMLQIVSDSRSISKFAYNQMSDWYFDDTKSSKSFVSRLHEIFYREFQTIEVCDFQFDGEIQNIGNRRLIGAVGPDSYQSIVERYDL